MTSKSSRQLFEVLNFVDTTQKTYIEFARENDIEWADVTRHIPLPDDSVEVIYSSHMLEHLDREAAGKFLNEALRVLMPGGLIRIAVPDLRQKIEAYVEYGNANEFMRSTILGLAIPRTLRGQLRLLVLGKLCTRCQR